MSNEWKLGTLCVEGGYKPKSGEPRVLPIVQSTTYKYFDAEDVAGLFDLEKEGHMYSRISNPTASAFEEKMTALEGGVGAVSVSSGQAATMLALLNICKNGDHIVSTSTIYGGTYNLFAVTFEKMGIDVTFVNPEASLEEIRGAFKENTKALFGETIGNPGLNILDFEKFSSIAKEKNVPLLVDNTLATPYLCRPLEHGANIVIHSATKYIDGHGTSVGGVIVDGGNFDWACGKYNEFTEADKSYHGLKYVEKFGNAAYIVKLRVQLLRDLGTPLSPFNAFLMHLGLETLHVRMERHCENALKLAKYLENHEKVNWVSYPFLESHKSHDLALKYLPKGSSGILTFGIKGGAKAGDKLIKELKLVSLVVHLGDLRTSLLQPSSTTHRQLSEEEQIASGVTPDLIRVSVGIEDIDDIINDFQKALSKI